MPVQAFCLILVQQVDELRFSQEVSIHCICLKLPFLKSKLRTYQEFTLDNFKIFIIKQLLIFIKYFKNSTGIRKISINKHPLNGGGSNASIPSWIDLSLATSDIINAPAICRTKNFLQKALNKVTVALFKQQTIYLNELKV